MAVHGRKKGGLALGLGGLVLAQEGANLRLMAADVLRGLPAVAWIPASLPE